MVDQKSVPYMTEYLKYALEFEKYVYIWQRAMNEANSHMRRIYGERQQLEQSRSSALSQLASLDQTSDQQFVQSTATSDKYKKRAKTIKRVLPIFLLLSFVFGCLVGFIVPVESQLRWVIVLICGVSITLMGAFFAVPIALIVYFVNKSKEQHFKDQSENFSSGSSRYRQKILLESQVTNADTALANNAVSESALSSQQEEISASLESAKATLTQIYGENILPPKYQNLSAVATMYEYLSTGRCDTIQGHGGIYDTYEKECLEIEKINQLVQINQRLENIEQTQRLIYREMQQANQTLSGVLSSLRQVEKSSKEIAKNTAISAQANQQTAAATQWIAWNAWAHGY